MRFGLFTTFVIAVLLPVVVGAQSLGDLGGIGSSFTLSAAPQYPTPYSKATLSFLSSSLDLINATVTVTANGKRIYKGSVQPVAVTLGRGGSVVNVTATISSGGVNYSQTLSIQPQEVSLIAEPISSAPPLYPGKPLVPFEGSVRVVAVANLKNASGASLEPTALAYSWTVDGVQIANSSGIGKEAIMVASPLQYRERTVSVAVMSTDGSLIGGASLSLSPLEPSVQMYENDPLLGILYDHALSDRYTITGAESTLYAAPFSLPTTSGAPLIRWFLNGAPAQTGSSITLRPTGSGEGSASLSLVASAGAYTTATANLSLSFGAKPGFNFFGL
jgi:hypothetical protein